MRASMIGVRPESIISTLARLTSTPMTLWPMEAKQAAETEPTYPNPKMLTDEPNLILLSGSLCAQTCGAYFADIGTAVAMSSNLMNYTNARSNAGKQFDARLRI